MCSRLWIHICLCAVVWLPWTAALAWEPMDPNSPPPPVTWERPPIKPFYTGGGSPVFTEVDGKSCVETTRNYLSKYIFFNIDNRFVYDVDETFELEIEYDSTAGGQILLEYDSHNQGPEEGTFCPLPPISPDTSRRWAHHTFTLERARFADRQHKKGDFRLSSPDGIVRISDVKLRRLKPPPEQVATPGTLRLKVIEASTGQPTPARVGLYGTRGQFQIPNEQAVPLNIFYYTAYWYECPRDFTWPVKNHYAFYIRGQYTCDLPAGQYELVVRKGIEYHIAHETLTIESGKTLEHTVTLKRWGDLGAEGWYSGDVHVHVRRSPEDNEKIMALVQAEDLHLANMTQMGNVNAYFFAQYAFGEQSKYRQGDYELVSSEEDPRTSHVGHTLMLNMKTMVRDEQTYFLYHKVFEEIRRQGGLTGYAHGGEAFHAERGMALDVPFNIVDFVEILQATKLNTRIWYEFLNLGYKLVPSAGSDFPYIDPPGLVRSYVHVDGPFSAQRWFEGFAKGYTFATTGPLLTFSVNSVPMGGELQAQPGEQLRIEATARVNPDVDEINQFELVAQGQAIRTEPVEGKTDLARFSTTLTADRSTWVALRVKGKNNSVAHTAPVYVIIGGQRFWKPSVVPDLVAKQRQRLKEMIEQPVKPMSEIWPKESEEKQWAKQKALAEERVKQVDSKYESLLKALPAN